MLVHNYTPGRTSLVWSLSYTQAFFAVSCVCQQVYSCMVHASMVFVSHNFHLPLTAVGRTSYIIASHYVVYKILCTTKFRLTVITSQLFKHSSICLHTADNKTQTSISNVTSRSMTLHIRIFSTHNKPEPQFPLTCHNGHLSTFPGSCA